MRSLRFLGVLFAALFLHCLPATAQDSHVLEIHAGYDGWFRPGEWTPFEISLKNAPSGGALEIVVNDSLRFTAYSAEPAHFRTWVMLSKPAANKIEVYSGDALLYSTTRNETTPIEIRSANPEFRLVGIFFGTPLPLAQAAQLLNDNAIHAANLQSWHFARSDMMQSLDRVVTNDAQLRTLAQAQHNAIAHWQKGHGRLDNIDALGLDRNRFLSYIINAEALREVCHANFALDQNIYRVFSWTEIPVFSFVFLTALAAASGTLFLLVALLLPASNTLMSYGLWTLLALCCAGASCQLSAGQPMSVQENASIILLDRQDSFGEQLLWTSRTSHVDGERFPDCNPDTAVIPVLYTIRDNPYVRFKHPADALAPFSTGFSLERNRRPVFFRRTFVEVRGTLTVDTTTDECNISNYSGVRFSSAYLLRYGKAYPLGPISEGAVKQSLDDPQPSLEQLEKITDRERQLLSYWAAHIGNPLHVYFVGIPDYGYGGLTEFPTVFVQRVSE